MVIKKSALWLNRLLWVVLVSGLVLSAAYVSIGRNTIAYIDRYQGQLLTMLSDFTGLPVAVNRLGGRWSKLSPIIEISDLKLYSPVDNEPVLSIASASFQIDPIESLLNRSLTLNRIAFSGIRCTLEEFEPGRWRIRSYPYQSGDSNLENIIELVLALDAVEFHNTELQMNYFDGTSSLMSSAELSLLRDGDFRRLHLEAGFGGDSQPLRLIVEAEGDPRDSEEFSALAYVKFDDIDFVDQLPFVKSLGLDLQDARIDSEVWARWQPGRRIDVQGFANTPYVDVEAITGRELQPIENVQLSFRAESAAKGSWRVWLPELQFTWRKEDFEWQKAFVTLSAEQFQLELENQDLQQLSRQLLDLELLKGKPLDALSTLSPTGQLQNIHLTVVRGADEKNIREPFVLRANLDAVNVSAWAGAPGAKGLSGYLELGKYYGLVDLDAEQFSLDFPTVYKHWLDFDSARAQVRWTIGEKRIQVHSGPIKLTADHGPATGLLALDLPYKGDPGDPEMTLVIGLEETGIGRRDKFLPYTLSQDLLSWLDKSLQSGMIVEGGFIYRGSLVAAHGDDRTVQLFFDVEDGSLSYHDDWPAVDGVSGMVIIDDSHTEVIANRSQIFGLAVEHADVELQSLASGSWLTVDAVARGNASDALRVINESAIKNMVGTTFEYWQLDGDVEARVALGVPLGKANRDLQVDVDVDFENTGIHIPDLNLNFDNINGRLAFNTERGLHADQISGEFFKCPFNLQIDSSTEQGISIDFQGKVSVSDIYSWSAQPALAFAEGDTDVVGQILIDKDNSVFTAKSSLQGVAINLPEPFFKAAESEQAFWLTAGIGRADYSISMGLGDVASLQLDYLQRQLNSAQLTLGDVISGDMIEGHFTVAGRVEQFTLDDWLPIKDRYLALQTDLTAAQKQTEEGVEKSGQASVQQSFDIIVRNLYVGQFVGFGQQQQDLTVSAERNKPGFPDSWWLSAQNPLLEGDLLIYDDSSLPLKVDLHRLEIPSQAQLQEDSFAALDDSDIRSDQLSADALLDAESQVSSAGPLSAIDPRDIIASDVSIDQLVIAGDAYGSINFQLRSDDEGFLLNNITGNIRGLIIEESNPSKLRWRRLDGNELTSLKVEARFVNLGDVLDSWNYEPVVSSKKGRFTVDVSWPGRPDQWLLINTNGRVGVDVKKGQFVTASETASGTLRVVGIFNFTNVMRRLKLDFSDLYEDGISYDDIQGSFSLANHQLNIVDSLEIKTPSSRFQLRGDADLLNRNLDMELIATLPVANNLPWMVALAGGLPVAAGVFVVSKIFEEQVDKISSLVYSIKGDWNDPRMKFERVFTDKKRK